MDGSMDWWMDRTIVFGMIWNFEYQNNEFNNPEQNPVRYDLLDS